MYNFVTQDNSNNVSVTIPATGVQARTISDNDIIVYFDKSAAAQEDFSTARPTAQSFVGKLYEVDFTVQEQNSIFSFELNNITDLGTPGNRYKYTNLVKRINYNVNPNINLIDPLFTAKSGEYDSINDTQIQDLITNIITNIQNDQELTQNVLESILKLVVTYSYSVNYSTMPFSLITQIKNYISSSTNSQRNRVSTRTTNWRSEELEKMRGVGNLKFSPSTTNRFLENLEINDQFKNQDSSVKNAGRFIGINDGITLLNDILDTFKIFKNLLSLVINNFSNYTSKLLLNNGLGFSNLEEIRLPSQIEAPDGIKIEALAFLGCVGLKNVENLDNATEIGPFAFAGCTNLGTTLDEDANFVLPNITTISSGAFAASGIKNIEIPANVKFIKTGAFALTYNLNSVTAADGSELTDIYTRAFSETLLETVNFSNCGNLKNIHKHAFSWVKDNNIQGIPITFDNNNNISVIDWRSKLLSDTTSKTLADLANITYVESPSSQLGSLSYVSSELFTNNLRRFDNEVSSLPNHGNLSLNLLSQIFTVSPGNTGQAASIIQHLSGTNFIPYENVLAITDPEERNSDADSTRVVSSVIITGDVANGFTFYDGTGQILYSVDGEGTVVAGEAGNVPADLLLFFLQENPGAGNVPADLLLFFLQENPGAGNVPAGDLTLQENPGGPQEATLEP